MYRGLFHVDKPLDLDNIIYLYPTCMLNILRSINNRQQEVIVKGPTLIDESSNNASLDLILFSPPAHEEGLLHVDEPSGRVIKQGLYHRVYDVLYPTCTSTISRGFKE